MSGAVSPFERDDLGPWLTDPARIAQWDVLCVAKLDRLTRSIADFVALADWCKKHGKTLVSIGDSFDLGTSVGRMVATMLAMFAQFERERMAERRADHTRKAMAQAHWDGRSIPPGYRPVKVDSHFELELDLAKTAQVRDMAQAIIAGTSARQVAKDAYGVTDASKVLSILRNPALRGYVMHDGQPVRGEDGLPVTRTPVLDDDVWHDLQAALGSPNGSERRKDAHLLLGVAHCGRCQERLYGLSRAAGDRYRHGPKSACQGSFLARTLERIVERELLSHIGHLEMTETVTIVGENHDAEIKRVEDSIRELDTAYEAGDIPATAYGRMQGRLEAKLDHLRSLPNIPDRTEDRPTSGTYAEHWAQLDQTQRGAWLRESGVRIYVIRQADRTDPDDLFGSDFGPLHDMLAAGTTATGRDMSHLVEEGSLAAVVTWNSLRILPADRVRVSGINA